MIRRWCTLSALFALQVLGEAHRLFATESPSYYFTKRPNLLFSPMSIGEGSILVVEPSSLSGAIMRLRNEHLQRHRSFSRMPAGLNAPAEANAAPPPSDSGSATTAATARVPKAARSIQHLFGNPWWIPKKNQQLRKIRSEPQTQPESQPESDLAADDQRDKRLHVLSLLRGYNTPVASSYHALRMAAFNDDGSGDGLSRPKRLHALSLLRGFGSPASAPTPYHGLTRSENGPSPRQKRLHALSLLRGSSASVASLRARALSRRKRVHTLSLLRGYNLRPVTLESSAQLQRALRRSRRALHNLSLLRGYQHAAAGLRLDAPRSADEPRVRLRRKSKRVHNLSLLRYDGKLFQNVFSPQDGEFQQKRFQQKRYPYY